MIGPFTQNDFEVVFFDEGHMLILSEIPLRRIYYCITMNKYDGMNYIIIYIIAT